jgi:hypothetical protein
MLKLIIAHLILHVHIELGHNALCVQLQRGSGEVDESWLWKKTGYVFTELSNVMKIQKDASHKASNC